MSREIVVEDFAEDGLNWILSEVICDPCHSEEGCDECPGYEFLLAGEEILGESLVKFAKTEVAQLYEKVD